MLEVNHINVFYGQIQVLWDVSLHVDNGEMVAILGPNGAGKSTLLKTILGMNHPKSGSISYEGKRIDNLPPHKIIEAGIYYVPEGRRIFPDLTVIENLELGAITKKSLKMKEENLKFVYRIFPILKEREKQIAGTLSGGEMQMLALGRGLMSVPKLLMIDEPSLGLAPKVLTHIFKVIKEVNERGVAVLIVEQNVHQTLALCNRAYVLENGRVVLFGGAKELANNDYIKRSYMGL